MLFLEEARFRFDDFTLNPPNAYLRRAGLMDCFDGAKGRGRGRGITSSCWHGLLNRVLGCYSSQHSGDEREIESPAGDLGGGERGLIVTFPLLVFLLVLKAGTAPLTLPTGTGTQVRAPL